MMSEADDIERKKISDGFLSEVSTPDHGTRSVQNGASSAENRKSDQDTSDLSPPQLLPNGHNTLNFKKMLDYERASLPTARGTIRPDSRSLHGSPEIPPLNDYGYKREKKQRTTLKSSDRRREKEQQNPSSGQFRKDASLKRRGAPGMEEKPRRRRGKGGTIERHRGKGSAQWSHLSEEELKKLRRVKNRESVEKCRTKQRLRMEALQVERTCLQHENNQLREAISLTHEAIREGWRQAERIKGHIADCVEDDTGDLFKEFRKEVQI